MKERFQAPGWDAVRSTPATHSTVSAPVHPVNALLQHVICEVDHCTPAHSNTSPSTSKPVGVPLQTAPAPGPFPGHDAQIPGRSAPVKQRRRVRAILEPSTHRDLLTALQYADSASSPDTHNAAL